MNYQCNDLNNVMNVMMNAFSSMKYFFPIPYNFAFKQSVEMIVLKYDEWHSIKTIMD